MVGLVLVSLITVYASLRLQMSWMRIFSEKQGIPSATMEGRPPAKVVVEPKPDTRPRLRIPVPGGMNFRKP